MVGFFRVFNDSAQHIVSPLGNPCPARSARARRMRSTGHGGGDAITAKKLGYAQCAATEGGGAAKSVAAAAQWRLRRRIMVKLGLFGFMALLLPRAEQRLAASLRISVGLRSPSSASAQHSGISHLNLKRIPTSI
jgi:hypothetical protein